jgi:thiol-disulfide isomerase/thioredoxin
MKRGWKGLFLTAILVTAMSTPTKTSELDALSHATEWINSPPLTAESLRGKVVLVQFWTYSCINWLRTMPYVRAWAEKYRDKGLVVIGVHSPEFDFEKQLPNVRWGAKNYRVDYPIAVDSDFEIWRGFSNQYWPALYLIDGKGKVRYTHFGEGSYLESERAIQKLLAESGVSGVGKDVVSVAPSGVETQADWADVGSPETYVGTARSENQVTSPAKLRLNQWTLGGEWTVGRQAAVLEKAGGRLTMRFHARDLNLVIGPGANGKPVRFRVLIDGKPPGADHGMDTDAAGNGQVTSQRLYQLVRQKGGSRERLFTIQFLDPGVEAYAFTFG